MTPAQKRALTVFKNGPVTPEEIEKLKIQQRVLNTLEDARLIKFYKFGKPPAWKLTQQGKQVV